MVRTTAIAAVLTLLVLPPFAAAQQVPFSLQITDGLVTLHAQNTPVRTVLTEWSRVGGTKIVNADAVSGTPLTLDLRGVSERQALDLILRGVAGYMLAARPAGSSGTSAFDRIVILATSTAPRTPPAAAFVPGQRQVIPAQPVLPPDEPSEIQTFEPDGSPSDPSKGTSLQPNGPGFGPAAPQGGMPQRELIPGTNVPIPTVGQLPFGMTVTGNDAPPAAAVPAPVTTSPGNPFGVPVGTSAMPGVVTPVQPARTSPTRSTSPNQPN